MSDYLDALTRLGIVLRLGAWSSARAKREIKAPKLHFMDTGLATALRGGSDSFGIELEKSLPFQSNRCRYGIGAPASARLTYSLKPLDG
ncbi:DUF4143 domain-containing protein [Mesorhizobium sp. YC-39]|uniref:DUF4143 domain-containing protein n=1 Tax=unclassified Mesorhizobium TaxID=325217 RepID=UPI0021E7434E|nr:MULTISPECIES: DUF4143 domain-containing protein [unclassified Mesorhizobium]MCV3211386.1 DUF4143 domain-containing protein [Mesorhizobium sp. YC-2]MCV3233111.1 DUF4143 domain-containing protein [Mesorhizobium sp. YC-39]